MHSTKNYRARNAELVSINMVYSGVQKAKISIDELMEALRDGIKSVKV